MPISLLAISKNATKYYDANGEYFLSAVVCCWHVTAELGSKSPFPSCSLKGFIVSPDLTGREQKDFAEFITSMLRLAPEDRPSARDLLGASWLKDP